MGKRQTRIFNRDLSSHIVALPGIEANILLTDNTVLHGIIVQMDDQVLTLKDMRMNKHLLAHTHIQEIIIDKESLY